MDGGPRRRRPGPLLFFSFIVFSSTLCLCFLFSDFVYPGVFQQSNLRASGSLPPHEASVLSFHRFEFEYTSFNEAAAFIFPSASNHSRVFPITVDLSPPHLMSVMLFSSSAQPVTKSSLHLLWIKLSIADKMNRQSLSYQDRREISSCNGSGELHLLIRRLPSPASRVFELVTVLIFFSDIHMSAPDNHRFLHDAISGIGVAYHFQNLACSDCYHTGRAQP